MKRDEFASYVFAGLSLYLGFKAVRAVKGDAKSSTEAEAYHGAMQLYRTLATFFGKKAMLAEAAYWKAIGQ